MTRYIFANCIAAGPINWKSPLTAEGQPEIAQAAMIGMDSKDESFHLEMTEPNAFNLNVYSDLIGAGAIVVGHSVEYHHGHFRATMIPKGIDPCDGRVQTICTMLALTGHVEKRNGRKGWPTFDEACDHFGVTRAGTESAQDNARCLMAVFAAMQRAGIEPTVRTWKERNSA